MSEESGQKVLSSFVIMHGSTAAGKRISEVEWPEHCLLIAVKRGEEEIIPRGRTLLLPSDTIIAVVDERDNAVVHDAMEELCRM